MGESLMWVEKYRPKTLDEVLNHEEVVKRLKELLKYPAALPHLMFAGPPGNGKTSVALCIAHQLYGDAWREYTLEMNASVTPDTPIMVRESGTVRRTNFAELAKAHFTGNDGKYAFPTDLEVLSYDKRRNVKFMSVRTISRHKVSMIARIKYEGGEIKTSLAHSLMVLDGDGNLAPKKAEDLKRGDMLVTFRANMNFGNLQFLNISEFKPELYNELRSGLVRNPKVRNVYDNIEATSDASWMFGLYLAEGCAYLENCTSGGTIFTLGYPSEMDKVQALGEIFDRSFNLPVKAKVSSSGFNRRRMSSVQVRVLNTQLAKFFLSNFYGESADKGATTKRVPRFMYQASLRDRMAFLKGYMGDATGKWGELVRYSSRSRENLVDVAWLGRISGLDTSCFRNEARIVWKLPSYSYLKTEFLPGDIVKNFIKKLRLTPKHARYLLRHQLYSKRCKRISKHLVEKILQGMNPSELDGEERKLRDTLIGLVESPLSVVIIKDVIVQDYDDYVYDVSVPDAEVFWGGTTPILLHNSDERGIGMVRGDSSAKEGIAAHGGIKAFSRLGAIGAPFRLILLDEADNMTSEAQTALRRIMEQSSRTSRFILICNYSSRIIEPIQSRCAIFRFSELGREDVLAHLKRIADKEGVKLTEGGAEAIWEFCRGDLRRSINTLQAASVLGKTVSEDGVVKVVGKVRPKEVHSMLEDALKGDFSNAREKLYKLLFSLGLPAAEVLRQIYGEIYNLGLSEEEIAQLAEMIGEYDYRLMIGANEDIQLSSLLARISALRR